MATRKSRQNTESPISFSSETVPTTPTTPATRNTRSIRNKQLQQNKTDESTVNIKSEKIDEDEEAVKDIQNDDNANSSNAVTTINEKADAKEIEQNDKEKEATPSIVSTRKRRVAATIKDESNAVEKLSTTSNESVSPTTPDDGKTSPNKSKRSRRSAFELLTGSKPDESPSVVSKRRNSTGKIEKPTRKLSSRIKKLKQLRKTTMKRTLLKKPEKLASAAAAINKPIKQLIEKQVITKGASKTDKNDSASDTEILKMSRRRSDSVSKCSDMTDASSFQETKDSTEETATPNVTDSTDDKLAIKEETASEKDDGTSTIKPDNEQVDAVRSATTGINDSGIGGDSSDNSLNNKNESDQINDNKRPQRLPRRKRPNLPTKVINTRSRSDTPCKTIDDEEDTSSTPKEIKNEIIESPALHVETVANDTNANNNKSEMDEIIAEKNDSDTEKAKSLSPVLVSEGVSEISVKQFYGRADFLENNLGIEKDPTLGEIVQVQEKIQSTNQDSDEKNANTSETTEITDCEQMETDPKELNETSSQEAEIDETDASTKHTDMETDANDDEDDEDKVDDAKCDLTQTESNDSDCFVKPTEIVRKNSTSILNENLLVLNGEIEFRKKEKKDVAKRIEHSEVVLYAISSNGKLMNPEKLEKVLESQKLKEKERSDSIESNESKSPAHETNGSHNNELSIEQTTSNKEDKENIETTKNEKKSMKSPNNEKIDKDVETKVANVTTIDDDSKLEIDANESNRPISVANSIGSKDSRSSSIDDESPEEKVQKESHLKTLGLLTHQAAVEATIEKQKQREKIKASITSSSHGGKNKKNAEYTGTLKTVIKLHRGNNNDKKKPNLPIKMTLHKGRSKNGSDKSDSNSTFNAEDDTYYTIQQQEVDGIGESIIINCFY